tara:strand:- start:3254 stop:3724 length:471 start_codon:yes stop_codon:yes gene_type:complete
MKIKLTTKQMEWCQELAIKRSGSKNHAETKNSINCFKDKKGWHRHYVGVLGELAYSLYSGKKMDLSIIVMGDDGTDFDNGVDVKTSASKYRPDLLIFKKQYERKRADSYVLAWLQLPIVELVGSISRNKFDQFKQIKNFGYGDSYVVSKTHLNKII